MGKYWAAGALLALSLFWVLSASPLADARGRTDNAEDALPIDGPLVVEEVVPSEEIAAAPGLEEEVPEVLEIEGPAVDGPWVWEEPALPEVPARDAGGYAVLRELLEPNDWGDFDSAEPVSRIEAVTALYRLSGALVRADGCLFADVDEADWDAVIWASGAGVAGGVAEGRFAPDGPVTRSQLAVMLHRFAAWMGMNTESRVAVSWDGEEVPAYAEEAVNWVMGRRLYGTMTDRGLYPQLPVSRLQFAEILTRLEWNETAADLAEELSISRSQAKHEELEAAVRTIARRYGAVGIQVAVVEKGAVTDAYHYGWAVKGSEPMTDRHKMRVASLSKVAVGLSAALLQEEGVVDYDEDIGAYWGKNARNPRRPDKLVTIRSMLTHTSTLLNSESIAWDYQGVRAQLGSASGYGGGTPGSLKSWSYNNHAFGILGQTLELASGRYLDDVLGERVLAFLGADCGFAAGDLEEPGLVTPLYRTSSLGRSAASQLRVRRWDFPGASGRQFAGGFTSSARDFAKLIALLAGDGCFEGVRLMDAGAVEQMESHSWEALPGGTYQALPMRFRPELYGREGLYYHTGSAYGVYNLASYDPVTGDGVVVLTMGASGKTDAYGIYAIGGEISRAVYDAIK